MIPFNVPPVVGGEIVCIKKAIAERKLCGDGAFTKKCHEWFETKLPARKVLLTTSCTHALEMTAMLLGVGPGDEIVMPSFTFVSTASAFAIRGAKIVFVDIEPSTMNIDADAVRRAITDRTKAIVVVHYAGVACDMDAIAELAKGRGIAIVEDAAQGFCSTYEGKALGTIGDLGCFSFHETKNVSCGEGGLLVINDPKYIERAEIIREKGTNRAKYFRGMVDKYTWVDIGSSYLPSELNAAYLYAQLQKVEKLQKSRMAAWDRYNADLRGLADSGYLELPRIPEKRVHNAHMFYIKAKDLEERTSLIAFLKGRGIGSAFHYIPLHSSPYGQSCGRFSGKDEWTTKESNRLLRLPLWYGLGKKETNAVAQALQFFYSGSK
jgi:dTDP-4-amino-4,6-dideoxygalactose transaminase